jgi:hypothetical protein
MLKSFSISNPTPKTDELITELWKKYSNGEQNYMEIGLELNNRQHPTRLNALNDLEQRFTGHF